jgi:hypothetical protein
MSDNNNTERRIVVIRPIGDRRFKQWVKVVTGVDTTIPNGYAFQGSFIGLDRKAELAVGTFLLYFGMEGSRTRQWPCVALKEVTPDGRLETLYERYDLDRSWALDVRDDIAAIIAARRSSSSADVTGDAAGSVDGAANPLLDAADPIGGDLRPGGQRMALADADAAAADADTGMACRRRRIIAERDEDEAAERADGGDSP